MNLAFYGGKQIFMKEGVRKSNSNDVFYLPSLLLSVCEHEHNSLPDFSNLSLIFREVRLNDAAFFLFRKL